jgi:hypothetical protein
MIQKSGWQEFLEGDLETRTYFKISQSGEFEPLDEISLIIFETFSPNKQKLSPQHAMHVLNIALFR